MHAPEEAASQNIAVSDAFTVSESITIRMRTYYSDHHIWAAAHFARMAAKIESEFSGEYSPYLFIEHRSYVTASIFGAASFLEATINELFADAADNSPALSEKMEPAAMELLGQMWVLGVPKTASYSILEKFQIALALTRKPLFKSGRGPYQDVKLLVELRNALIHYVPEWVAAAQAEPEAAAAHKFEKKLRRKFPPSPLMGNNPYFPDKCLGHGCAKWAVDSALKFTDQFCSTMGLTPRYDLSYDRSSLKTE